MFLACSVLFAGMIVQAEKSSAQLIHPVISEIALKSGNEELGAAATNNWSFWKKFNEWEALSEGKNGIPKNAAKAAQILNQLIKGVYLVKFGPADGFNPQTPAELLKVFSKTSSLKSGKDRLGGSGFFRTKRNDNKLIGSFLTEQPDQMRQDIEKNPQLVFISMEEITPDKFAAHVKAAQESSPPAQSGKNTVPFRYAVQANEEVVYEVCLDGKFVSSGKTLKQYSYLSLSATPGDHVLTVTAPGYETWQKTVTLLEGSKNGQNFLVELKKPAK